MDIKKENIFLDSEMSAKLSSLIPLFSFKNKKPEDLIIFPDIGTSYYMSPEVLNKDKIEIKCGEKIEIYSLGATLYNLAFGIYPYGLNDNIGDDYNKIKKIF